MDRAEQLADYLAGDLGSRERAAVETALERDPRLRAQLDAMRAGDDALRRLESPTPPPGFEERLDAVVAAELATLLDDGARSGSSDDELARRRHARRDSATPRGLPRWVTAVSGAAAAIVLLAGAGIVASGVLGGGDDEATFDAQGDIAELESDDSGRDTADDSAGGSSVADGPQLRAGERTVDETDFEALLGDGAAFALTRRGLDAADADQLASSYAAAFAAPEGDASDADDRDAGDIASDRGEAADDQAMDGDSAGADEADTDDTAAQGEATEEELEQPAEDDAGSAAVERRDEVASAPLRIEGEVSAGDRERVAACLDELLTSESRIVPVYAEMARYDGDPVIVFGLVSDDPATGLFTRREVWVVDRGSCAVRHFLQDS